MVAIIFALSLVSCDDDSSDMARIQVRLTDSPSDYDAVLIDVQSIQINFPDDDEGWILLGTNKGVYDLLQLTNGIDTLLADGSVPEGTISQLRLILGEDNFVVMDGDTLTLSTPGAQQSGLKLKINETLLSGITYVLMLDFDAARSIVKAGNSGKYNLKPVIRVLTMAADGAITGVVEPAQAAPVVYALQGDDTVASTFASDTSGMFLLKGLAAGSYTLGFDAADPFLDIQLSGIAVEEGVVTRLDTLGFQ